MGSKKAKHAQKVAMRGANPARPLPSGVKKCIIPFCGQAANPKSKHGLCLQCEYILSVVSFWDQKVAREMEAQKNAPQILIPKPGMEKQAVAAAAKKAHIILP